MRFLVFTQLFDHPRRCIKPTERISDDEGIVGSYMKTRQVPFKSPREFNRSLQPRFQGGIIIGVEKDSFHRGSNWSKCRRKSDLLGAKMEQVITQNPLLRKKIMTVPRGC